MTNTTITHVEQRGTLTYLHPNGEVQVMDGWFMLAMNNTTVVARKPRGRNRWQFCGITDVLAFEVR